ncbi:MAG: Maltose/maltodextrin transporter, permease protein MalF [Myxococcales bacterium]|nr:Maltose/maltodextrin transporter, permease protein MalF [Myxococcales bacterium]
MITVVRQLRDFAFGAALAILIATVAFVAVRNKELAARQIDLATRAASEVAAARGPLPSVDAGLVSQPSPSVKRPYLRVRHVYRHGACRQLTASGGVNDKLFYDAINRAERTGVFAELVRDGSGRAIAVTSSEVMTSCGATEPTPMWAVAVTAPARPAPYPFLVIIGLLGLGIALSAAGALLSGADGRAARAGTVVGIAVLAIPCVLWQAWVATIAIVLVGGSLALLQRAQLTDRLATGIRIHRTALGFLAPAAISMIVLVAAPFVIGLVLGFYDHHHGTWTFVGLHNFGEILSGGGRPLDDPLNFWFILGVTVLWTVANVAFHVTIGVALALLLSRPWLRAKGVWRMLFILPWAVPNYITALIWKGMFTGEYGAVNSLLEAAGLDGVSWFSSWATSFSANVITNTWLGFPFMMVVALGALESIPKELYEAASVDGASAWQRFRHITMPHLRPALGPAVALGSIWTFNMFNVIYLVSAGQPGGATNILVTDAYRWAFERGERYGMAAAYATIIFGILLLWTVFGTRIVRSKEPS